MLSCLMQNTDKPILSQINQNAMKRIIIYSGLIILAILIAMPAIAQDQTSKEKTTKAVDAKASTNSLPGKFVDNNNDGICDYRQVNCKDVKCSKFTDKNGDGICDFHKNGKGCCLNPDCCRNCCGSAQQYSPAGKEQDYCCGKGPGYRHRHGMECFRDTVRTK